MRLIKKFFSYYKPHSRLFFIDMTCAFIVALCDLFYPFIARNIINVYVPARTDDSLRLMLIWAGVLLLIYLVKSLLNFVLQYWGHVLGVRIQADMRRDMFRHLQRLPLSFFDEHKTGTLMSRIINDLMQVSELAHHGPEDVFISGILLIGSFIMLSTINIYLTLIVFAVVPFMVWFAVSGRRSMKDAFRIAREEIGEVNAGIETSISGMRVSRSYTGEEYENRKFDVANGRFAAARNLAYKVMGRFFSVMGLFNDLMYLIVLVAGGLFFYYGKINAGEFAAYLLYITMFLKPINKLVNLFEQIQDGLTGLSRFDEIVSVATEKDSENAITVNSTEGHICFENVSFKYNNSDKSDKDAGVITDLTIDIPKGRTVALVGPSGGGKTTLCHLIPRFYEPTAGRITIDGIDIKDFALLSLRQSIGMVAQEVFLFNGTIRENIAYGKLDATQEEVIDAAKKANIHDYIMTLEKGYDSTVGERGLKLSGGQKQRISIARVFLKNPSILILDEATSALDNMTEMLIQNELTELSKNRTCIIVAHRLSTVKHADEIILMDEGGIKERGTHETLLALNGMYAALYKYQFRDS